LVICLQQGANDIHMVSPMPMRPHHLLLHSNTDRFNRSGAELPGLSWKKRPLSRCLCVCLFSTMAKASVLQNYTSGAQRSLTSADVGWLVQTVSHMVNKCPKTMLHDGSLQRLRSAFNQVISWVEQTATKALGKRKRNEPNNR